MAWACRTCIGFSLWDQHYTMKGRVRKQDWVEGEGQMWRRPASLSWTHGKTRAQLSVIPREPEIAGPLYLASSVIRCEPCPGGQDPLQPKLPLKGLTAKGCLLTFPASGRAESSLKGDWSGVCDFVKIIQYFKIYIEKSSELINVSTLESNHFFYLRSQKTYILHSLQWLFLFQIFLIEMRFQVLSAC